MYADNFFQIVNKLSENAPLKLSILSEIQTRRIVGKVLEGVGRADIFRSLLCKVVNAEVPLEDAFIALKALLPEHTSPHKGNKRVFSQGWEERLIRTQLSRFYNQCVLFELKQKGITRCHVPHSVYEDNNSECSLYIAGKDHDVDTLLGRLISSYEDGNFDREHKIPHHPHCTHVVKPK